MDEERIQITDEESGERIDALLSRKFPALSRSLIQKCMEAGTVTVNDRPVKKNARGSAGDEILFAFPETEALTVEAQQIPLDVVYEDGDLIIINKERGMVVHPAPGHPDGTLVNALLFRCGDSLSGIGGVQRPGIVHRIDKDTSGLLVVAKNDFAHQGLSAQLSDHSLCREYVAVVNGNHPQSSWYDYAGGVTGGTIENCVVSNCVSTRSAGGVANATVVSCLITGNSNTNEWSGYAGGLYHCKVYNSTIVGNIRLNSNVSGAESCYLFNNIITGNKSNGGSDTYDVYESRDRNLSSDVSSNVVYSTNLIGSDLWFVDASNGD